MREEVLRLAGPVYTSRVQPGASVSACQYCPRSTITDNFDQGCRRLPAGNTAAVELCTLLLTDQEVLDVVLCLHDIRAAQLWNLLPSTRARLPPPVFSGAFARRLSQRQRSASGDHLDMFVEALGRDTIVEGDPLLRVWDSMHRAMLLVLAALQSLPIHPHPQHLDPVAATHTSTKPQLPPGYHRCSACLLLSLCLALRLGQFCIDQLEGADQLLTRLHATLPGLLLGLSTAVSVMQAAGHPEADAHRLLLLRYILHLGPLQRCCMDEMDWVVSNDMVDQLNVEVTTSCPDHLARLLASSPVVTGWPGHPPVKPSSNHSSAAGANSGLSHTSGSSSSSSSNSCQGRGRVKGKSPGQGGKGSSTACSKDLAIVNSFAHVAQALCAVLRRQEEGLIMDQLISTCKAEGQGSLMGLRADASCLATAALEVMVREYDCLNYMARILGAASAPSRIDAVASGHQTTPSSASSSPLISVVLSVLPRCLVVLQGTVAAVRFAATLDSCFTMKALPGCFRDSYSSLCKSLRLMMELWPDWRCRPAMLRLLVRTAAAGAHGYSTLALYGAQLLDGAPDYEAETRSVPCLQRTLELKGLNPELKASLSETMFRVCAIWIRLLVPYCDTEQASIDMYNSLYDSHQQGQYMEGSAACGKKEGHILLPSAQQLAPLALDLVWGMEGMLQPASWLPCGNSLVEGWCSQLLARVCQLFYINSHTLKGPPDHIWMSGCQAIAGSHMFLFQVQEQAPTSMSPEAERLLSCLTLVLTVALPLDAWLAVTPSLPADGAEIIEQAIHDVLACVEPEQVWSWQALAVGTPAEASLASVLQGAANKLQLPHLVAPAPRGLQPGRLTLDRGRGPRELMVLCLTMH
ncbi:hypothetical protein QJQ45_008580 [Haematococcus lacustris]|nr:hypothetical protein QJQ45_008580 [Haematococcus lacustris]